MMWYRLLNWAVWHGRRADMLRYVTSRRHEWSTSPFGFAREPSLATHPTGLARFCASRWGQYFLFLCLAGYYGNTSSSRAYWPLDPAVCSGPDLLWLLCLPAHLHSSSWHARHLANVVVPFMGESKVCLIDVLTYQETRKFYGTREGIHDTHEAVRIIPLSLAAGFIFIHFLFLLLLFSSNNELKILSMNK